MPTTTIWLDDEMNIVDPGEASLAYEKDTDHEGQFVGDRWIRMVRPDSPEADRLAIDMEARRLVTGRFGRRPRAFLRWGIVLILLAAATIWLLLG
jgi:hypothetical protein